MPDGLAELLQSFDQPTSGGWSPGFLERGKRREALDKAAFAIRDALDTEPDPLTGEQSPNPLGDKLSLGNLSQADRLAKVGGYLKATTLRNAFQEISQRRQQADQQQQFGALRLAQGRQQMQDAGAFDQAMSEAGQETVPAVPPDVAGAMSPQTPLGQLLGAMRVTPRTNATATTREVPITLENAVAAIARNRGAINAPQADNQLRILAMLAAAKERTAGKDVPIVAENLPGGYKGFRLPGTGQMDIRPDLTTPWTEIMPGVLQGPGGRTFGNAKAQNEREIPDPPKRAATSGHTWRWNGWNAGYVESPTPTATTSTAAKLTDLLKPDGAPDSPTAATSAKSKSITDNKGKKWLYMGTASDPSTDRDPKNWQAH